MWPKLRSIAATILWCALLLGGCQCGSNQEPLSKEETTASLGVVREALAGALVNKNTLLHAINALGYGVPSEVMPQLMSLLKITGDIAIGNTCMMALAQLKKQEAVPAIIDFVSRQPPLIIRQGIIAVHRIGGQEAVEWLYVLSMGADDQAVRREANRAYLDLTEQL